MGKHLAKTGASAGKWVTCPAKKNCRNGGMHVENETLKRVQAWKNDGASKRTNLNEITEEDIKSYSSLPAEMKQGYANDLKSETKAEKARIAQEKEDAHIARMTQLVIENNERHKRAEREKAIAAEAAKTAAAEPEIRRLSYINALSGEVTYMAFEAENYSVATKRALSEFNFAVRGAAVRPTVLERRSELETVLNKHKDIIVQYHSPEDIEHVKTELNKAAVKNNGTARSIHDAFIEYQADIDSGVRLGSHKHLNAIAKLAREAEATYQARQAKEEKQAQRENRIQKVKDTFTDGENIKLPNIKVTEKMNTNDGYVTPMENIAKRLSSFFGRNK